jgi:hypothetical protein
MKFEEARKKFVDALTGHIVDGPDGSKGTDFKVYFPSKKVLDFLSTVNDPMDEQAILLLRDELPEDEYPRPDSGPLTWTYAISLIRKYQSDAEEVAEMCCREREIEQLSTGKQKRRRGQCAARDIQKEAHSKRARQRQTKKKGSSLKLGVVVLIEPMTKHQRQFIALVKKIKAMSPADQLSAVCRWSSLRNSINMVRQVMVECGAIRAEEAESVVVRVDENKQLYIEAHCIDEDAAKRFVTHLEPMEASGLVTVSKTIREERTN